MNHRGRYLRPVASASLALALLASLPHPAQARERAKQALSGTGVDDDARGQTRFVLVGGSNGRFDVVVHKLERKASFELLVDGVKVGTLVTDGGGNGRIRFRSRPRGHDLVLGFDPRGAEITLRDANGQDVLRTSIPAGGGGGGATSEVACCLPDRGGDGAVECEDRTADACTQAGGVVAGTASCLPNPCEGAPQPDAEVVCCLPDSAGGAFSDDDPAEHEVECEDRTPAQCAAQGGTVVSATSCTPDPCTPTPPPAGQTACCIPDDSGTECEVTTASQCEARGGTLTAATACAADTCPGGAPDDHGGDTTPGGGGTDDHGGGAGHGHGGGDGAGHR